MPDRTGRPRRRPFVAGQRSLARRAGASSPTAEETADSLGPATADEPIGLGTTPAGPVVPPSPAGPDLPVLADEPAAPAAVAAVGPATDLPAAAAPAAAPAVAPGADRPLPAASARPGRRAGVAERGWLLWVLAGAAAVLAAVLGVLLFLRQSQPGISSSLGGTSGLSAGELSALETADRAVTDVLSYSYTNFDAGVRAGAALLTPAFRRSYLRLIDTEVRPLAIQYRAVVRSVPVAGGICDVSPYCPGTGPDRVVALIFFDRSRTSKINPVPTIDAERATVDLVRAGNGWLVSYMTGL
jgi:Mce-associated membrane protein